MMNDCNVVVLLGFAVFFGCITIGFVLASASLPANDDEIENGRHDDDAR